MSKETARYTKAHAWMDQKGEEWVVGISDYAAGSMGDIIYVELPEVGAEVTAGEAYGNIESAKAVEDLIAPLSGTVTKVNGELESAPEIMNDDPFEAGWTVAVAPAGEVDLGETMDAEEYAAYLETLSEE
jgi:glycine cleavage system H protein